MHFSFSLPGQLLCTTALKSRKLQTCAFHCLTLLYCRKLIPYSGTHVGHSFWLKNLRFIPFTSSLVQSFYFTLLHSTAGSLCFVSGCWRSPRPCVITQWLTDWQALLSWPSQLQVNPNSWTMMDGSWHRTDSNWRETKLTWVLCHYSPLAKHVGGHYRSLDLCKQASLSAGEVLSNKGADSCGHCLEVINRSEVSGGWMLPGKMSVGKVKHPPLRQQLLAKCPWASHITLQLHQWL